MNIIQSFRCVPSQVQVDIRARTETFSAFPFLGSPPYGPPVPKLDLQMASLAQPTGMLGV